MMYQDTYFVDKASNTPGDILLAYGLLSLLERVASQVADYEDAGDITLEDKGDYYEISLPSPLSLEMVENQDFFPLTDFIETLKNVAKKPHLTTSFNYEHHKKTVVSEFHELRKNWAAEIKAGNMELREQLANKTPDATWPLYQAVNQMAAIIGYNDLVLRWEENKKSFSAMLKLILEMTSVYPNWIEEAQTKWNAGLKQNIFKGKAEATASQLFNPASGKGQNSLKANSLTMGNLSNFWLLEFLKGVGAFQAAAPRIISNAGNPRAKDRKLYVLAPHKIEFALHKSIWQEFQPPYNQNLQSNTSIKMDIAAALSYTRVFLANNEVQARIRAGQRKTPKNYVMGLWSVFYKDLGNSSAVMNLSFIGLPDWIKVLETGQQIDQYQEIIKEHENLLRSLNEERAEEYELLRVYRDFLSGSDLNALFDFCAGYGQFVIRTMESDWERRGRYLRFPSFEYLEVIVKEQQLDLEAIIQNQGFRNIAYAIRHSSVIPQRRKSLKGKSFYEIRYGLGQELKRKAQYPAEFMVALSDFVQSYNQETEQLHERFKEQHREKISIQDLEEITALIQANKSELICNMLVAFGYSIERETKEGQSQTQEMVAPSEEEAAIVSE